ncbi:MAG: IMP dehydrogenase [Nitrososphaerota archaeon]|nr:IMP dehydrogenase [Nitrososphaerota archaeon]
MGVSESIRRGLTFDDVLLVPKFSSIRSRKDAATRTKFSRGIELSIPIVSANMDTVTESAMAIAMARMGGIGVIHRFMPPQEQAAEVARVKRSEGILIEHPITLPEGRTVGEARRVMEKAGVGGIVIVDRAGRLVGLVTTRDVTFEDDPRTPLSEVMTPRKELITAREGVTMEEAKDLLRTNRVEKLPVLGGGQRLAGLITAKDIVKRKQFPEAAKDGKGRLRVAAAVGVKEEDVGRAEKLLDADADALVVDIAHGHSLHAVEMVRRLKKRFGDVQVVAGNVATAEGTSDMVKAGADAVKVGVGPGSICITRVVAGVGVPQLTAILDSARDGGACIIADGGIRQPGDVTKALAAGACSVMVGGLFAGTEESPGPTILKGGLRYKLTRGMASLTATADRRARESGAARGALEESVEEGVPEGVEGLIPYRGSVAEVVRQLVGGLRSGMSYCGARSIEELRANATFVRMSDAGLRESLPHDIERTL